MASAVNFALIHVAISVRMAWCCGPVASEKPNTTQEMDGSSVHNSSTLAKYFATGSASVAGRLAEERRNRNENGPIEDVALSKDHTSHNRKQTPNKYHRSKYDKHRLLESSAVVSTVTKTARAAFPSATLDHSLISPAPSLASQLKSTPMELDARGCGNNERLDTATAQVGNLVPSPSLKASDGSEQILRSRVQPNENMAATSNTSTEDLSPCELWERCPINHDARVSQWLRDLPNCPCVCPRQLFFNSSLYDRHQNKYFHWRVVSSKVENEAIVRWSAAFCILQELSTRSTSVAVQVCCYDNAWKLVTRGVGAGTPYLASPDVSEDLHEKLDILPLFACLGDWTRFHVLRPPNNGYKCPQNPNEEEYALQVKNAQDF